jgi:ATP-dependent Clp protease protease subunit
MHKDIEKAIAALLAKNIILLEGKVCGDMVMSVYKSLVILEARGSPAVEIRIFTDGGSVRAGLDIYDALRRYAGKKTGVVYAYARSMGAIILQACEERVCLEHASVLIHHVNTQEISLDVIEDPKRLVKLRESMWVNQKALYEILVNRTGKSEKEIRDTCKKDQDMNAEDALKFGLIDRIEKGSGELAKKEK